MFWWIPHVWTKPNIRSVIYSLIFSWHSANIPIIHWFRSYLSWLSSVEPSFWQESASKTEILGIESLPCDDSLCDIWTPKMAIWIADPIAKKWRFLRWLWGDSCKTGVSLWGRQRLWRLCTALSKAKAKEDWISTIILSVTHIGTW